MFKTLKNAWRIPELKKKLLFTLLIIVLYRLGANIPVPYISPDVFSGVSEAFADAGGAGSILTFLNILSGDALGKATLFALGVSPYITSSIVVQLLTIAIPKFQEWSKDESGAGKKKLTMFTRITTVGLAIVTSIGYVFFLDSNDMLVAGTNLNFWRGAVIVACYCAGASLVMWLAEKINERGIGNGISMILFANILAGMFSILSGLWTTVFTGKFVWTNLVVALIQIVIIVGIIAIVVWMSDAERRIPIQYAKRVVGRKMYGGQNTNLPIKVNMSGVMPIIFANSIVALPATIAAFMSAESKYVKFITTWFNYNTWVYILVFLGLLIFFAYFYVSISFDPIEISNNIKNNGGAIPGIRSGNPTAMYIRKILNRVTLVGALIVAFIAVFPMIINMVDGMIRNDGGATFTALAFSGSSFMIVVGVALETIRELEAQMSIRNYKGFLD